MVGTYSLPMTPPSGATPVEAGHVSLVQRDLPTFRVSDTLFAGGHHVPSHYHERACLSVVVEGCFVQRFPGREVRCTAGGVLCKPPEERHDDVWLADSRHFILEPAPEAHHALGAAARAIEEVRDALDPGAAALARLAFRELRLGDDVSALALEGLVLQLLARAARLEDRRRPTSRPAWLARVEERLHDDPRRTPSLTELGRIAGVHPAHVSRTFSAVHGHTVGEHVRRLRLRAAQCELEDTDRPLSEVALRAGYSDQSHLTRALRRATGLTPARYRALMGRRSLTA